MRVESRERKEESGWKYIWGRDECCLWSILSPLSTLLLPLLFFSLPSSARSIQTINADKAREVAREQIIWNGRLCPFSTFALDFLKTVYGDNRYKGLSPEQVVCGWILRPEIWKEEPMIHIPDENLRQQLQITGEYAKFSELFDDTLGYKLNTIGADLPERMRQLARETPAAISLDEKVGEIILLTKGELFHPRPDNMQPLPAWRVEVEILWNNTPYWVFMILIAVAVAIGLAASRWHKKWLACESSYRQFSCYE